MTTDPTAQVARDLAAILRLRADLGDRAVDLANSSLMPGGEAIVELAHVARSDVWLRRQELDEAAAVKHDHSEDADPDDQWTAYQTLRFWSEAWRIDRDADYADLEPTVETEANWLRGNLDSLRFELHFEDFARDVARAKAKLESVLIDGTRPAFRGVPCLYDECGGARLLRMTVPARGPHGEKVWRLTDWTCVRCRRTWDEESYARMVISATESLHYENFGGEAFRSYDRAAQSIGRPTATMHTWADRMQITAVCRITDRRVFVSTPDVAERHELAIERARRQWRARIRRLAVARLARIRALQTTTV